MAKILNEETYLALKNKADGYDAIVAAIVTANADLKPEDVTTEVIQEVISSGAGSDNASEMTELRTELQNMTSERDNLQEQVTTLTEENAGLKKLPTSKSVTEEKPKTDMNATENEDALLDFATKHSGDTMAIVNEMKRTNYKPSKLK